MRQTHELKTDPLPFEASWKGKKPFEIRYNDRGYKVEDRLVLKETKYSGQDMELGAPLIFTGRELVCTVTYILEGYGLKLGWIIMGVEKDSDLS
jgi:hypothetical protein